MGKFAIINGMRMPLHKAKALTESTMPEEQRLFERAVNQMMEVRELEKRHVELVQSLDLVSDAVRRLPTEKRVTLVKRINSSKVFYEEGEPCAFLSELLDNVEVDEEVVVDALPEVAVEEVVPVVEEKVVEEVAPDNVLDFKSLSREELKAECESAGFDVKKNTPSDRMIKWLETGKGPVKIAKPAL